MRKYYLFNLKREVYDTYRSKPNELYKAFYNIYKYSDKGVLPHIILKYKDISCYIDKYCYRKCGTMYLLKNKKEKTVINLKDNVIIITSTKNNPDIFILISRIFNNVFVIDFYNDDYFYLNDIKEDYEIYK